MCKMKICQIQLSVCVLPVETRIDTGLIIGIWFLMGTNGEEWLALPWFSTKDCLIISLVIQSSNCPMAESWNGFSWAFLSSFLGEENLLDPSVPSGIFQSKPLPLRDFSQMLSWLPTVTSQRRLIFFIRLSYILELVWLLPIGLRTALYTAALSNMVTSSYM